MNENEVATAEVGGRQITVVTGDLTEEVVDAIVNAANSRLSHGGGVAGAIVRRGGVVIQRESDRLSPVAVGEAVVTAAGSLACSYVIHAVGPIWGEGDEVDKLDMAVTNALARADELGLTSVAMPAVSTGIFGFPKREGCEVIVRAVARHLGKPTCGLREVRLVSIDRETADHFAAALTTFAER